MNGPPLGPLTVPEELVPSPQSIVAVYSAAVALGSRSLKLATSPLKLVPSVAPKVIPPAVIGSSGGGVEASANWKLPGVCVVSKSSCVSRPNGSPPCKM